MKGHGRELGKLGRLTNKLHVEPRRNIVPGIVIALLAAFTAPSLQPVCSGVTRLQWARVQVFQKGPLFPPKKLLKNSVGQILGPPQRWARVHCTPCTPYCYATAGVQMNINFMLSEN